MNQPINPPPSSLLYHPQFSVVLSGGNKYLYRERKREREREREREKERDRERAFPPGTQHYQEVTKSRKARRDGGNSYLETRARWKMARFSCSVFYN